MACGPRCVDIPGCLSEFESDHGREPVLVHAPQLSRWWTSLRLGSPYLTPAVRAFRAGRTGSCLAIDQPATRRPKTLGGTSEHSRPAEKPRWPRSEADRAPASFLVVEPL